MTTRRCVKLSQQTYRGYEHFDHECPHCGEALAHPDTLDENISRSEIYRRHRRVHFGWSDVEEEDVEKYLATTYEEGDDDDEDEEVEQKTFVFRYHCEHVEEIVVKAAHEDEAREEADFKRTYNGEYVDTVHTEVEEW